MRKYAIERFGGDPARMHTITNGFNTSVFKVLPKADARRALSVSSNAKLMVFVGRLVREKGLLELLSAFENLAQRDPSLQLAILGDGQMKTELAQLIAASKHAQSIHALGAVSHAQVAQWIAAADLLTLPSWSEGYPNVVVEALACGRPVVATAVGGIPEIVDETSGILFPAKDARALENALATALARNWDADAIAARMRRTWDDVAAETLAVCQQLVTRRSHR
jgi:glycosyltransferase involved in cell wall biosynthesis